MNKNEITVLVADDTPTNANVICKFLESNGFGVVCAVNGQDAVDKFIETSPDIVVMDVMMPVKDGYEATKEIKAIAGDKWIPLIFLSSKITIEDQVAGLDIGGDAYLTKPVDLTLFNAKLKAMLRIVGMQRKLNSVTQYLQVLADKAADEIDLAKVLIEKLVQRKETVKSSGVHEYIESAEDISGDIVLSFQCEDPSKSYFILADATGHGLSAAISIIPLSQLFYRLTSENASVSEIISQINARLEAILPPNRFVAATIGFIDRDNKSIEVWNGANPSPRLVNSEGDVIHAFEKNHFCLGVVPAEQFTSETETYHYDENCELLFFSDGIIDAQNNEGKIFGNEGIIQSLMPPLAPHQIMFDKILSDLNHFRDHNKRIDDIGILSVRLTV